MIFVIGEAPEHDTCVCSRVVDGRGTDHERIRILDFAIGCEVDGHAMAYRVGRDNELDNLKLDGQRAELKLVDLVSARPRGHRGAWTLTDLLVATDRVRERWIEYGRLAQIIDDERNEL